MTDENEKKSVMEFVVKEIIATADATMPGGEGYYNGDMSWDDEQRSFRLELKGTEQSVTDLMMFFTFKMEYHLEDSRDGFTVVGKLKEEYW
jgi:hypothetical protein